MRLVLLCLTLAASQVQAGEFEGVITGKTIDAGAPKSGYEVIKFYLSGKGVRVEMTGNLFTLTMVWRAAEPGTSYILNTAKATYMRHDISSAQTAASTAALPTVQQLGRTTFLGRSVLRVKVTFASGMSKELWVDTSEHFPAAAFALFGREQRSDNAWAALEKAGLVGIPLKELDSVRAPTAPPSGAADASGKQNGWEATSVEKKSLPASLFQVPAEYHEAKSPLEMLPADKQAEVLRKIQNMTPEQRAQFDEMMKKAAQ